MLVSHKVPCPYRCICLCSLKEHFLAFKSVVILELIYSTLKSRIAFAVIMRIANRVLCQQELNQISDRLIFCSEGCRLIRLYIHGISLAILRISRRSIGLFDRVLTFHKADSVAFAIGLKSEYSSRLIATVIYRVLSSFYGVAVVIICDRSAITDFLHVEMSRSFHISDYHVLNTGHIADEYLEAFRYCFIEVCVCVVQCIRKSLSLCPYFSAGRCRSAVPCRKRIWSSGVYPCKSKVSYSEVLGFITEVELLDPFDVLLEARVCW